MGLERDLVVEKHIWCNNIYRDMCYEAMFILPEIFVTHSRLAGEIFVMWTADVGNTPMIIATIFFSSTVPTYTVKPVYNDHLYDKIYPLWFIQ